MGEEAVSLGGGCCAENCPGEGALRQQGSKRRCLRICFQEDNTLVIFDVAKRMKVMLSLTTIRFFPNLEEIPEESRCSTIMKERKEDEGEKCLQVLIVRK